jgi:2-C-methyl-D-erythritol 4-phosphate cytidylyltransferase
MSATRPSVCDVAAVIVAAGRSQRFDAHGGARKPLVEVGGRTLLEHAAAPFAESERVAELVLVVHPEDRARVEALAARSAELAKVRAVVPGGRERCDSVRQGVRATGAGLALVAVHDAARPLVSRALVEAVCAAAAAGGAALAALALRDTVKESSDGRHAERTLDRTRLWAAQTPQVFDRARFLELLERAEREGAQPTDDAALWERAIGPVALVPGEATNLKVTTAEDLELARGLLAQRAPLAGRRR